jgi:hypothetical protein
MRFRQNSILTLSILIVVVHFIHIRHATYRQLPYSDRIEVHIAPEYANEDVVKPASGLSAFFNIVQLAVTIKQLLHPVTLRACLCSKHITHPHSEIPIFLSYRVFRI